MIPFSKIEIKTVKIFGIIALSLLATAIIVELGLRLIWGLGQRPIFIPDEEIGYLLAPNQKVHRFGKTTIVNEYSMRSHPIAKERSQDTLRILMLGDSIINGNWWTDQADLISELIEKQLDAPNFKSVEVLNVSANSWSPRNHIAYLKRFGTFDAQIIILVINTEDMYGKMPTYLPVGNDINYPDKQPNSAIGEVLERYFYRPKPLDLPKEYGRFPQKNLAAMTEIKTLADQSQALFMVGITPLLREVENQPQEQEKRARNRLQEWLEEYNVDYIDFLPIFQQQEDISSLYRDRIHLSPIGDKVVVDTLTQTLNQRLEKFTRSPQPNKVDP